MPLNPEQAIFQGFYPRIYNQTILPTDFYPNFFETYLQRDVRLLTAVQNLMLFRNFVRLCAGRIGQPLNYQTLSADAGVSPPTAKAWLGILEASHICFLLPSYFRNFSKRIAKSPKLYFTDTGLAAWLLGITAPEDLVVHFARRQLFENMIVAELLKQGYEQQWNPELYFWRESNGHEIDLLAEQKGVFTIAEIKSAATINSSFFNNLLYFQKNVTDNTPVQAWLIYGGSEPQIRNAAKVTPWNSLEGIFFGNSM